MTHKPGVWVAHGDVGRSIPNCPSQACSTAPPRGRTAPRPPSSGQHCFHSGHPHYGEKPSPPEWLAHTSQASPLGFSPLVPFWGQWAGKKVWCPGAGGSRDLLSVRLSGLTWTISAPELGDLAW